MKLADLLRLSKTHAVEYGQGEVDYGEREPGEQCMGCRWFSPHDFEAPEGAGSCQLVSGDVMGNYGCKEYAVNPTMPEEPEPEAEPEVEPMPEEAEPMQKEEEQTAIQEQPEPVPLTVVNPHGEKHTAPQAEPSKADIAAVMWTKTRIDVLTEQHNRIQVPLDHKQSYLAIRKRKALKHEIRLLQVALYVHYKIAYETDLN